MHNPAHYDAVDYLVIGHLSRDQTPDGPRLGGTAAFSALTARALGLRVGIVSAWGRDISLEPLLSTPITGTVAARSTSFENSQTLSKREQIIHHVAPPLDFSHIPEAWRSPQIVHLGPIAQEVEPSLVKYFPDALMCATPQGWLRNWSETGHVHQAKWPKATFVLSNTDATVISSDDVANDEDLIEEMARASKILAVTKAAAGAQVFWRDEVRSFPAPQVKEIDSTGAGDIFAAAFFIQLRQTGNAWAAAEYANQLAAQSVTRSGLESIPSPEEINAIRIKV